MNRLLLLVLLIALVVIIFFMRRGPPPEQPGVRVQMGTHGARIDYAVEMNGGGCCG